MTAAILARDFDRAADAKAKVEEAQRGMARLRDDDGIEWHPKFFRQLRLEDRWVFVDKDM